MKKAVVISCFDWYEKRISPIRELLLQRGYEVTIFTSDYDHIKKKMINNRNLDCDYIHVPEYKKNISIQRIKSHLCFGKQVNKRITEINPDLLYLLLPPNITAKYCSLYKQKHPEIKLILDIIDMWPESMVIGRLNRSFLANVWKGWRNQAIKKADYIFTECDLYREKLEKVLINKETSTLHLYKKQTDEERLLVRELIKKYKDKENTVLFAYVGSMNSILDIDGICSVIQRFINEGFQCELRAIGDGENRERFDKAVTSVGCKTYFYGKIFDEKEKIQILSPCTFAFNMMKDTVCVGLTIKSIDYFSYGLPIINNIKGDTWNIVKENGLGINVGEGSLIDYNYKVSHKVVYDYFENNFNLNVFKSKLATVIDRLEII